MWISEWRFNRSYGGSESPLPDVAGFFERQFAGGSMVVRGQRSRVCRRAGSFVSFRLVALGTLDIESLSANKKSYEIDQFGQPMGRRSNDSRTPAQVLTASVRPDAVDMKCIAAFRWCLVDRSIRPTWAYGSRWRREHECSRKDA